MDYANLILNPVMSIISALIVYMLFKKNAEKMIENVKKEAKSEVEVWLNSEKGQKALYSIGAIVGNGVKSGIGIQTKGGKFKFQDLIGQIAGTYIQQKIIPSISGVQPQTSAKTDVSTDLNIH